MEDQKLFCFDQAFLKHVVNYDVNVQCDKIWDRNLFNLFIEVQRNTNYPRLMHLLNKCNENDVHMIIKVVFYIRGIRNKGRGERKIGRQCYQWLLIKYPLIFTFSASSSTICLNVAFSVNFVTSIEKIGS